MVSNGSTFNAYLMEERPKLRRVRQLVGDRTTHTLSF